MFAWAYLDTTLVRVGDEPEDTRAGVISACLWSRLRGYIGDTMYVQDLHGEAEYVLSTDNMFGGS